MELKSIPDNMVMLTREFMIDELRAAHVEVPESANIRQVRALYNDLQPPVRPPNESSETNAMESELLNGDFGINCPPPLLPGTNEQDTAGTGDNNLLLPTPAVSSQSAANDALMQMNRVLRNINDRRLPAGSDQVAEDVEWDNQLTRLRKQQEILLLQREIDALMSPSARPSPSPARFGDVSVIESMIAKFSADDHYDVEKWLDDLEDASTMLQFDERLLFVACRRMLEGTARVFMRTISVSTYNELKAALLKEFRRARSTQEVYAQLHSRRLRAGEHIRRYILEMQEIASKSNVPETELVDIIVEGIGDTSATASMLHSAATMHYGIEAASRPL